MLDLDATTLCGLQAALRGIEDLARNSTATRIQLRQHRANRWTGTAYLEVGYTPDPLDEP
jgi:hypothetical protein